MISSLCYSESMGDRGATFEETSFAQGRFRRAYKGVWTAPPRDAGRACVVKKFMTTYTWKPTDWEETLKINERARKLADGFNCDVHTNKPVSFTEVHVLRVVSRSNPSTTPRLNEYVTCEDYIPGTFNKWCNNYGFISTESASLPAFVHWSWHHTRGEEMVADLQGVRNPNSFILTDPVVMSLSGGYGATDTGVEGMAMFFLSHQCNALCQNLPTPTLADFRRVIPQPYLEAAKTLMAQVRNSTTYKVEIKFTQGIRDRVGAKFREIACS